VQYDDGVHVYENLIPRKYKTPVEFAELKDSKRIPKIKEISDKFASDDTTITINIR
jgi:hypothetical protein